MPRDVIFADKTLTFNVRFALIWPVLARFVYSWLEIGPYLSKIDLNPSFSRLFCPYLTKNLCAKKLPR